VTKLKDAVIYKTRKINLLIFVRSLQRRKNHAFSFFVNNLKAGFPAFLLSRPV